MTRKGSQVQSLQRPLMFYVYILQNISVGRYYVGVTENVRKRLYEHNNGFSKSTAPYRPFTLRRVERFQTVTEAYRRERFLKSKKSARLLELIIQSSPDVLAEQEVGIPIPDRDVGTSGLSGRASH